MVGKNPPIVKRLATQLKSNGMPQGEAQAIAISKMQKAGNLKPGTNQATTQGIKRGEMTPSQRAKDRAVKKSGGSAADYKYNANNNTAVKERVNPDVKKRK